MLKQVHLILDMSRDPIILPSVTPAEHFRVIVHPLASGQSYDSYLLEWEVFTSYVKFIRHALSNISNPCSFCPVQEAFRTHRVFGITGMASHNQANGAHNLQNEHSSVFTENVHFTLRRCSYHVDVQILLPFCMLSFWLGYPGIDYCVRIVGELISNEDAIFIGMIGFFEAFMLLKYYFPFFFWYE
jgi:hypothetical protein